MSYRPQSLKVPADQVAAVRSLLNETQGEFASRFSRSRFAVIRWETNGVKFNDQSPRFPSEKAWRVALNDSRNVT